MPLVDQLHTCLVVELRVLLQFPLAEKLQCVPAAHPALDHIARRFIRISFLFRRSSVVILSDLPILAKYPRITAGRAGGFPAQESPGPSQVPGLGLSNQIA